VRRRGYISYGKNKGVLSNVDVCRQKTWCDKMFYIEPRPAGVSYLKFSAWIELALKTGSAGLH